jgi:hypothetical protein
MAYLSSSLSPEPTYQPPKSNKPKTQSLKDILHEFGLIEVVSYALFQIEHPRPIKALLPSTFPTQPYPYDYFTLFFTPDLFRTITININRYANMQRIHSIDRGLRE